MIHQEIHVTVADPCLDSFKADCLDLKVKPIVIDLEVFHDVMTSSNFYGTDDQVKAEAFRIAEELKLRGHDVVRLKIESSPFRSDVPLLQDGSRETYFESHLPVRIQPNEYESLISVGRSDGFHVSRNPFKKTDDGLVVMVTLRNYDDGYHEFVKQVEQIHTELSTRWDVGSQTVEWAWFDTNHLHDESWLNNVLT